MMKLFSLLILSLCGLFAAACTRTIQPLSLAADSVSIQRFANLQAVATPEPESSRNVALNGTARASDYNDLAFLVFDGDEETMWSAGGAPSRWIQVALDDKFSVHRMELVVTQAPPGPTTHEVWFENGSGVWTLHTRFADLYTEDGQTLELSILPPREIEQALILTRDSPSWVAWRDIRIFGTPSRNE